MSEPLSAEALQEALDWIDKYEDALGHSYCNLNVGGGWAPQPVECTCGFSDKMAGWRATLDAARSRDGLDDLVAALDEQMAGPVPEYAGIAKLAIAALRRVTLRKGPTDG